MKSYKYGIFCLTSSALCIALCIVLEKFLSITIGAFRFSIGNLPIIISGLLFGPIVGAIVGCASDIIGSILVGYAINPIITLGAAAVGLTAGLVYNLLAKKPTSSDYALPKYTPKTIAISVFSAHIVGNIIIKSIGLHLYYGYPWPMLLLRIPLYMVIACIELMLTYTIFTAIYTLYIKDRSI